MKACSFEVIVKKEPKGKSYYAYSPALPGCFSNGRTIEEARRNIRVALQQHMASLRAHGRRRSSGDPR